MALTTEKVNLEERIDNLTKGMASWYGQRLKRLPKEQAAVIVSYLEARIREFNPTRASKENVISCLCHFSEARGHKPFKKITGLQIQIFLDGFRKSEEDDPLHQWIGTYNTTIAWLMTFYRWLYHPEKTPKKRPLPSQFDNISRLKRKEESIYNPSDMWLPLEDLMFVKYCPRTDIRCFHMQARDTSARPGELCKLSIDHIVKSFKVSPEGHRYAVITVHEKTTQRPLPLYDSIPYTLKWLEEHPFRNVPNAPFYVVTTGKNRGKAMITRNIYQAYRDLKQQFFPQLLKDQNVPEEDKTIIRGMLMKPWNPYIRRHTGLTEKFPKLGAMFNQYSGHKPGSKMPARYLHFFGAEASNTLLEAQGILKKKDAPENILKPRICPLCQQPNEPEAKFCAKQTCRTPLTPEAVIQVMQEKEKQEQTIKDLVRQQVEEILARKHGVATGGP